MRRTIPWILLWLSPAFAAAQAPTAAELVTKEFFESYQPEVEVSGNVIVGVMTAAAATALAHNALAVIAAGADGERRLCLKAASRDGIYYSKNEYRLPAAAGQRDIPIPYQSKLDDVVSEYGNAGDIAVAATAGTCEAASADYYLVRSGETDGTQEALIYLNSFGATDVFYELGSAEGWLDPEPCDYISEGRRTTFDFFCTIPITASREPMDIRILRERFGREQPSITIRVL
jgi:hypothetical protein